MDDTRLTDPADAIPHTATPGLYLRWAAATTMPGGALVVELCRTQGDARVRVRALARDIPDATTALLFRTVTVGPWTVGAGGDLYGALVTWGSDGAEYRPAASYVDALAEVRSLQAAGQTAGFTACLASRMVWAGHWAHAESPVSI